VRDYLQEAIIRNAVNFPSVPPDDVPRCGPTWRSPRSSARWWRSS
jgi:hypothetical protein